MIKANIDVQAECVNNQ